MNDHDQDREMRLANFEKQMRLCSKISNFIIEQTRITDRELLELAAKAAGWTWWRSKHGYWNIKGPDCEERAACCGWFKFDAYTGSEFAEPTPADALIEVGFNPLDDDGDALRLAVKLKIDVAHTNIHAPQVHALADSKVQEFEDSSSDQYAATRRAIVRAAAAIGRAM